MSARPPHLNEDDIPRQSLLALIPRRSLVKVVFLLMLLVVIVLFQRRADLVARHMTNALAPAAPAPTPQAKPNTKP